MTTTPDDQSPEGSQDDAFQDKDSDQAGVEVGMTDEPSTFEPEEDPEGTSAS